MNLLKMNVYIKKEKLIIIKIKRRMYPGRKKGFVRRSLS